MVFGHAFPGNHFFDGDEYPPLDLVPAGFGVPASFRTEGTRQRGIRLADLTTVVTQTRDLFMEDGTDIGPVFVRFRV